MTAKKGKPNTHHQITPQPVPIPWIEFFKTIDAEIEKYVRRHYLTMTGDSETHHTWTFDPVRGWGTHSPPTPDGTWRVFFHSCIHRLPNRDALWSNTFQNLQEGGRVFVSTLGAQTDAPVPESIAAGFYHWPSPKHLHHEMSLAGFVCCLDKVVTQKKLKTETYAQWLRQSCFSDLSNTPKAEIERFIALLPRPRFLYTQTNWLVIGIKLGLHNPGLQLRKSATHGISAVAGVTIPKGSIIMECPGENRSTPPEEPSQWHSSLKGFHLHRQRSTYSLINHSDHPNCEVDFTACNIRAKIDIKPGEELTLDYNQAPLPKSHPLAR
jgi:hypothetical protein